VSTGRHHGFESHVEQELLLVLDCAGELIDVLSSVVRVTPGIQTGARVMVKIGTSTAPSGTPPSASTWWTAWRR